MYPVKALRGIQLQSADLGQQGLRHDRRFMLYKVRDNGELSKIQLSEVSQCSLFEQQIVGDDIVVQYHLPRDSPRPASGTPQPLTVPANPETRELETVTVDLHGSTAQVYRMGAQFDDWFSACFGFSAILVYIGDGRRAVLGSALLPTQAKQHQSSWLSGVTSYIAGATQQKTEESPWLTFTDVAPFLLTTEASLRNVSARSADGQPVEMYKFRPNIVVDGEDEWAEDLWAELTFENQHRLTLTGNCVRCTSLNVDYDTGKPAEGEMGTVLKKVCSCPYCRSAAWTGPPRCHHSPSRKVINIQAAYERSSG